MKYEIRIMALCAMLMCLGACDRHGRPIEEPGLEKLTKGYSTESEVRTAMGQPETVWEQADGTRTLEYPKGPEGARTWMVDIGQDGKLKDYLQVLTEENFKRIIPGMSKEEVRRMLGKPRTIAEYRLKNEEVWDWRYLQPTLVTRLFNVHFDKGSAKVTHTSSSEDPRAPY